MSLSLIAGLTSGLVGGIGGYIAKKAHNKYADYLDEQEVKMPGAMDTAESIFQGNASQGLPGKETIEDDIQTQIARTMGLGKEVADSPSALLDLLVKSHDSASGNIRQLGVQDAGVKLQNRTALADFLSRAKAPMELGVQNANMQLGIAAEREKMMGVQELLQGITQGLTGMTTGFSNFGMEKAMKERNEIMNRFFDGYGQSEDSASVPAQLMGWPNKVGVGTFNYE